MKIQCSECGREIEKRGNRTKCIKCTNKHNKLYSEQRRKQRNDDTNHIESPN